MKHPLAGATLALVIALGGCGDGGGDLAVETNLSGPIPQIAAPNGSDWTQSVTETEDGGFLMGNPDAPVKLVEYASLTCPHCATFAEEATERLRDTYVKSGQVSWEFRNFLLGAPDVAMSVLARCQPPAAFYRTVDQLFEQQQELMANIDEAEAERIGPLPPAQQIGPLARAMELDTFFARRGMPESRFSECLADDANVQRVTDMTNRAVNEMQVQGTPTFFINGEKQDVSDWGSLEPRLRAAIGG